MSSSTMNAGSMSNHFGLFLPTILSQSNDEQLSNWLEPTFGGKIIGCYAQTELGHGSNVRGLLTIAEFDKTTQEFVLNTPTLPSIKWWPGTLGKAATHAIVYAQLILDGKEHGVQAFLMQIRDENHRPLPGIEVGDLGPKMGDHANDTGFLRLENVRIPREMMLAKNQEVTPEGKFISRTSSGNSKSHYSTMMLARASFIMMAGAYLARAVTIAMRYSCVRRQGFEDTASTSFRAPEKQIIDYQVQRYRVFKQLAIAYAFKFSSQWLSNRQAAKKGGDEKDALQDLKEIAATGAGLKGLCTYMTWEGIEDCRKCCGGNGYLMVSGLAPLSQDYVWQITAEGDYILMILQLAKFLLSTYQDAVKGVPVSEQCDYLADIAKPNFNSEALRPPAAKSFRDFLDLGVLLSWYKYRALVTLVDVAAQYTGKLSEGVPKDVAFNECALAGTHAVRAHCFYFLLRNFIQAIKAVADKPVQVVLTQVATLFGLCLMIDENWGGCLSRADLSMVKQANAHILDVLRPNAIALVDAFDIPDRVLGTALGNADGNVYEALYESVKKAPLNQVDPYVGYDQMQKYLDLDILKKRSKL
uniref:Acyl-coenzyme A oxidase n=1 Tax=Arcella intermedia TaxID=1963864 RepID=A0A6B2L0L2_9EUKA